MDRDPAGVTPAPDASLDLGEYCRLVEAHLTRVNGGHLVRIVGPGFALVRGWADAGIPLRVVFRGIDDKAERHAAGASARRPLRIEFCDADVRQVFDRWQRAVGLTTRAAATTPVDEDAAPEAGAETKRPSLAKHLERAIDRLARTAGKLDLPEPLRDGLGLILAEAADARDAARALRGADREPLVARVARLDDSLMTLARTTAAADLLAAIRREAEQDLAAYRGRLAGDAWTKAVGATADQLLRDRLGLPTLAV